MAGAFFVWPLVRLFFYGFRFVFFPGFFFILLNAGLAGFPAELAFGFCLEVFLDEPVPLLSTGWAMGLRLVVFLDEPAALLPSLAPS